MKKNKPFSPKRKNRIKAIRSIFEMLVIIALVIIIVKALMPSEDYMPPGEDERIQTEQGFIALSYFGVDRSEGETLISTERLEEHIKALKLSGYVTITQKDILDYYEEGKPLPEKSLFLIFEDGRRDTAIFSQKIMEKYNYKGTILTYAQNLENKDPKFLTPEDIKELKNSTFWEMGSNGYRLEYINVFDRHDNFLNVLDTYKFQMVSSYLDRDYDHYLMDYIRDESGIPTENLNQMQERIAYDYKKMQEIYTEKTGSVPDMYILMHSNTGKFGTNDKVSLENEKWITEHFKLNFNREGDSLNIDNSSVYDLSRMQPQAYWYTNHLLMRIWDDTGEELEFVSGDYEKKADWETTKGESEFIEDTIVLTSLPREQGFMKLKNSESYKDISVSSKLQGNKLGSQAIYLRLNEEEKQYISVEIKDNILYIYDKSSNKDEGELFSLDLDIHDGIQKESIDENKLKAEIRELETDLRYSDSVDSAKSTNEILSEKKRETAVSVEEGGEEYIPEIGISEPGDRLLEITLKENRITVSIDKKIVVSDLEVSRTETGEIALESSFGGYGYSQRNLADDVYDGVFKELVITKAEQSSEAEEQILYDNRLKGMEKAVYVLETKWNEILNWFIKVL